MPLFEYVCQSCQHQFDLIVLAGRTTEEVCPACQSAQVLRKVSSFSVGGNRPSSPATDGLGSTPSEADSMGLTDPRSCAFDESAGGVPDDSND